MTTDEKLRARARKALMEEQAMLDRMPWWERRRWRPRSGGGIDWSGLTWWRVLSLLVLKSAAIRALLR
jgi:hypothetical protein